jgi:hypothetical protein
MNRRELMQGIVAGSILASLSSQREAALNAETRPSNTPQGMIARKWPRLYLTPETVSVLKKKFQTDKEWSQALLANGNSCLARNFSSDPNAQRPANTARPTNTNADRPNGMRGNGPPDTISLTLGLLFHLTGDHKYADTLHAALQSFGQLKTWSSPAFLARNPPWHSELGTARYNFAFGNGYDVLHDYLSKDQLAAIRADMLRLGIMPTLEDWIPPGSRIHSLDSMGHNWWGVCVSNCAVGCLSLVGDEPRANAWVELIDSSLVQWFNYNGNPLHNRVETFQPGGASYEGAHYTGYGVANHLNYMLAWKNAFPKRKPPTEDYVRGIPEFIMHTVYPTSAAGIPVNFEDCLLGSNSRDIILLLRACGVNDDYAEEYLRRIPGRPEDPLPLYVDQSVSSRKVTLPLSKVYPKMGWAMMRTSWDDNATLLAVKCGFTWNHAHADASSFILLHGGKPLIIDSGTCSYGRPEYHSYYRQSLAHNVVLFNGEGQPLDQVDFGTKFRGGILQSFDAMGLRYVGTDGTGPMANLYKRSYRHFLWLGKFILIIDDIETYKNGTLSWLLHPAEQAESTGPGKLNLHNGSVAASFTMLYPQTTMEIRKGLKPETPDQTMPYYSFSVESTSPFQRFISVIDLDPSEPNRMQVEDTGDVFKITLAGNDAAHTIYLNRRSIEGAYDMGSKVTFGDWTTDAYLLLLTTNNSPTSPASDDISRFCVIDGSFLRKGDQSLFETFAKSHCLWTPGHEMEVASQGQEKFACDVHVSAKPAKVTWNGKVTAPRYDEARQMLQLRNFDVAY